MTDQDTLIEFSVIPIGQNENDSIAPTVAHVVKRVKTSGLPSQVHSLGTVVEGGLDECIDLLKDCLRDALKDAPRVTASVRLDIRPGHPGRIEASVRSVEEKWREEAVG